jgi:hypothetical protein
VSDSEPSLLDEFRAIQVKEVKCVVCFKVSPEVREIVEDGLRRGIGPVTIMNFLRKHDLWSWSESPITTHRRHFA